SGQLCGARTDVDPASSFHRAAGSCQRAWQKYSYETGWTACRTGTSICVVGSQRFELHDRRKSTSQWRYTYRVGRLSYFSISIENPGHFLACLLLVLNP